NVKLDFFVDPSKLMQKDLLEKLSKAGKVYPILKFNYSKNDSLNKKMFNQEKLRIKNIKDRFELFEKPKIFGAFLKSGITTISNETLSESGYNFFITDSLLDRSVPIIFSTK